MANDFENGVWRTVGGRRIFIRDGESLSSAMKKSGKFKSAKKKDSKDIMNMDPNKFQKEAELEKKVAVEKEKFDKEKEYTMDGQKITESDIKSEYEKERKAGNIDKDMSYEDYKNSVVDDKNSNVKSVSRESEVKSQQSEIENEAATVKTQMNELEKASGSKVKEAFETDLFGNGKEHRFILENGTAIGHTLEAFGQKEDSWYIEEGKGPEAKITHYKSYDDIKKRLSGGSDDSKQSDYTEKQLKNVWKKEDATEVYNHLSRSEQNKMAQAHEDLNFYKKGTPAYENAKQYIEQMDRKAATKFLDKQNKSSNNSAYKKAFEDYKKKHPNSKLTLQKFIDMSEGK